MLQLILVVLSVLSLTREYDKCLAEDKICFTIGQNPDEILDETKVRVRITCEAGWCALGLGTDGNMLGATIFVVWRTGDGIQISERFASNHALPRASKTNVYTLDSVDDLVIMFNIEFDVDMTLIATTEPMDINGETTFIWAVGEDTPEGEGDDAEFQIHIQRGSYTRKGALATTTAEPTPTATITEGPTPTATSTPTGTRTPFEDPPARRSTYVVHGALMMAAWMGLTPLAIFIARYLKPILDFWWFRFHAILQVVTVLLTSAAFVIVIIPDSRSPFWIGAHAYVGILVVGGCILQVVLGYVIDRLYDQDRERVPWRDQLHWWLGRLLYVLSLIAVTLGLAQSGAPGTFWIAYGVLLGLSTIGFVAGQIRIGPHHH